MDLDRILKPEEIIDRLKYAKTQCVKGYYYVLIRPDLRDRIIELLKEQEAVPVIQHEVMHMLVWCCGSCGVAITDGDKFCRNCGKAVKWE